MNSAYFTQEQKNMALNEFKRTGSLKRAAKLIGCSEAVVKLWNKGIHFNPGNGNGGGHSVKHETVDVNALYELIGRLTAENESLKKKRN